MTQRFVKLNNHLPLALNVSSENQFTLNYAPSVKDFRREVSKKRKKNKKKSTVSNSKKRRSKRKTRMTRFFSEPKKKYNKQSMFGKRMDGE